MPIGARVVLVADIAFSILRAPLAVFAIHSWHARQGPTDHLVLALGTFGFWVAAVLTGVAGDLLVLAGKRYGLVLCSTSACLSALSILIVIAQLPAVFAIAKEVGRPRVGVIIGQGAALVARLGFLAAYATAIWFARQGAVFSEVGGPTDGCS